MVVRHGAKGAKFFADSVLSATYLEDFLGNPGKAGAGGGDRTRIASLEGWNSTIELHPRTKIGRTLADGACVVNFGPCILRGA